MPRRFPDAPRVLVAGLGRCGTSLVMQMLAASGLACLGDFPDYEEPAILGPTAAANAALLERFDAAKWLNPLLTPEPPGRAIVVWLDRHPLEQARSQVKFLEVMRGRRLPPEQLPAWAASIERDREASIARLRGRDRIELQFEHLVGDPAEAAASIADFAGQYGVTLDAALMARCVVPRSPLCAPDMAMEHTLIARGLPNGYDS